MTRTTATNWKKIWATAAAVAVAIASVTVPGAARPVRATNLITNGDFEQTTNGLGQFDYRTKAVGWTSTNSNNNAYNFLFTAATDDGAGVQGQFGTLKLWGPGTGSNNGLVGSPTGGNYVGADSAFQVGAISQLVAGLTVGHAYQLDFWWGAAQQYGFDGATTDYWQVTFGSQVKKTATINLPNHGFSGWMKQSFTFTASSVSQTLSFLAFGTPSGVPPFALLDGVSMIDVTPPPPIAPPGVAAPEPSTVSLLFVGLLGAAGYARRRKARLVASA